MASRRDTLSLQRRAFEMPHSAHSAGSPHAKAAAPAAQGSALAPAPAPAPSTKPKPKPQPQPSSSTIEATTSVVPPSTASVITTVALTDVSSGLMGSTTLPSAGSETGTPQPSSQGSHTGLIAGIAAGVLVTVVLLAGLLFRTRKRRRKEAWEAEQYQRRGAMNKFSRGNGSSTLEYGDGSDLALHQQQQHYQQDIIRQQVSKQPEWFAQKSPLDYYKQVPALAELKRQQHGPMVQQEQQHQQAQKQQRPYPLTHEPSSAGSTSSNSSSSGPLSLQEASVAARALTPTPVGSEGRAPKGESIALSPTSIVSPSVAPQPIATLQPYRQQQYQQPRISTHALRRPSHPNLTSPISPSSASTNSNPFSPHPNFESPITPQSPTQSGLISNDTLYNYTPPPPSAPVTPVSPPPQPSPGFYDFLLDDEVEIPEEKVLAQINSPNSRSPRHATSNNSSPGRGAGDSPGAATPPPIPRATRPMSVSSISSVKLAAATSREHKVDASAPEVPAVPTLPSLVMSS